MASIKMLRSATFAPFTTIEWDFFLCDHASHTRRLEGRFFPISYKGSNRLGPKKKSSSISLIDLGRDSCENGDFIFVDVWGRRE